MKILGIRCSNTDFTYSVIEKDKHNPKAVHETASKKFPKGYGTAEVANWLHQEIEGIVEQHHINAIGIKGAEPMGMKGKNYGLRMEKEGIIISAAAQKGIKFITRKTKGAIAKDLGQKGRSKYIANLDTSWITNFEKQNAKTQESILVAWSMIKE